MAGSAGACGIFFQILAGLGVTAEMVFSKWCMDLDRPYWRITAISCTLTSLSLLMISSACGASLATTYHQGKWLFLATLFGCIYWGCSIIAVQIGASPGDVSALTSINIIVAALMGRLFLNESLRCVHFVAVLCSVAGVFLISRPEFVFGSTHQSSAPLLGYIFAIASGFLQGCFFICSRKAGDVSEWMSILSLMMSSSLFCALLPLSKIVSEASPQFMIRSSWEAVGLIAIGFATTWLSAGPVAVGSLLCPAAVSATVYTAASMGFGYIAQTVLFDAAPTLLNIGGALLMLLAVVLMALTRASGSQKADVLEVEADAAPIDDTNSTISIPSSDAHPESIPESEITFASFVASEFAEYQPEREPVRLRRPTKSVDVLPQTIVGALASDTACA